MKIVMTVDKKNSAIGRLAEGIKKNNPHFNVVICDVHPKRPSPEQLDFFLKEIQDADIWDAEYWKTAMMLLNLYPEILKPIPKMLAHYNPYNLTEENWDEFDIVTVANSTMKKLIKNVKKLEVVPITINIDFFKFQRELPDNKIVLMVSSRIEGKKGILPVAQICKKLGYKMLLVGRISDREYFNKIMETGVVEFRQDVNEEELLKAYYESNIYVFNSIDNYESGNMPILEAMATGVPILTRNIGHVPDLDDGTNMLVRKGSEEDLEDLENELKYLMEDRIRQLAMRENAWKTVKSRNDQRRAFIYEKIWWKVKYPFNDLVSYIIPTFNRKELLIKVIEGIVKQDWPAKEIIICDDGSGDGTPKLIEKLKLETKIPIKYINTNTPTEYNLAYARNLGVLNATGEILIFLDDRYYPHQSLTKEFLANLQPKYFLYGNKGIKRDFVENISCIYKQDLVNAGMFNTTIKKYGFQTQEIRNRFKAQKFKFKKIDNAKVDTLYTTKSKYTKKQDIKDSKDALWKLGLE